MEGKNYAPGSNACMIAYNAGTLTDQGLAPL
jgi:hypothetical protein